MPVRQPAPPVCPRPVISIRLSPVWFAALALAGCSTTQGGYPSLARRPAEIVSADAAAACAAKACRKGRPCPASVAGPAAHPGCASAPASLPAPGLAANPLPDGRVGGSAGAAPAEAGPEIPAAGGGDLATRLDRLLADAESGSRDFATQQAAAEAKVRAANGSPAGSEAWAQATEAISLLQMQRSATAVAIAELDRIDTADRFAHDTVDATTPEGPLARPDGQRIAAARARIEAVLTGEDAVLDRLTGTLDRAR